MACNDSIAQTTDLLELRMQVQRKRRARMEQEQKHDD